MSAKTRRPLDARKRGTHRLHHKRSRPQVAKKAAPPSAHKDGRERDTRGPSAYELERAGLGSDDHDKLIRRWLERDFSNARRWVARTEARNDLIRLHNELALAQAKYIAIGGDIDGLELNVKIAETSMAATPVQLTAQQLLLARAHTYATNAELAAFLGRRVTESAVRQALHRLSKIDDAAFVAAPVFVKPRPKQR